MNKKYTLWILISPIILVWGLFFSRASFFWGSEGYYFFGWLVPPITAYLLWQKTSSLPAPANVGGNRIWWGLVALPALVLFGLVYGMYQTMPFWRPLLFFLGLVTVAFSFSYVAYLGGKQWVRHFLSLFFIGLICLPWPSAWEGDIVFRLTMAVTKATEVSLNLLGYAASHVGNRIDVQGQSVEVGEACSGIRSFQGLFMVGIVVGELYGFRWRRIALMIAAFAISFPLNILRALALSVIVVADGREAYDSWHDPLGGIVYAVGCLCILGFGQLLQSPKDKTEVSSRTLPEIKASWIPSGIGVAVLGLFAILLELHFTSSYEKYQKTHIWKGDPEVLDNAVKGRRLPIDPEVYEILQYDDGNHLELFSDYGDRFEFYDFSYDSGVMGVLAAEHHTPEICVGKYGGGEMKEKRSDTVFSINGEDIPVFSFTFGYEGGYDLKAFQGVWIGGTNGTARERYDQLVFSVGSKRMERVGVALRRLLDGQRDYVVQVFLIVTYGEMSIDDAWSQSEVLLRKILSGSPKKDHSAS